MPRKPKTETGRRAQGVEAIPGQVYGAGVEQEQLQRAMPAPNVAAETSQQLSSQANAAAPQMDFQQLLSAAAGAGQGAGLLGAPTARPDEPLTAGLPLGRGPGPEVLQTPRADPPGVKFLQRLSDVTGDPYFVDLARRGQP